MQCYNNYYMHVAEQLVVKAFLHLNFRIKVFEMNASSNSFSITP